jgi:hypothetical protein
LVLGYDKDDAEHVAYRADLSARLFGGGEALDVLHWNWDKVGTLAKPGWRPSIFMPRWASRITLRITDVRVERLLDISVTDAMAEGCAAEGFEPRGMHESDRDMLVGTTALGAYRDLWLSIHGGGAWDADPFVWVVGFEMVTP